MAPIAWHMKARVFFLRWVGDELGADVWNVHRIQRLDMPIHPNFLEKIATLAIFFLQNCVLQRGEEDDPFTLPALGFHPWVRV